jgi:hypothetical protein
MKEARGFPAVRLVSFIYLQVWRKHRNTLYVPLAFNREDWKYIEGSCE